MGLAVRAVAIFLCAAGLCSYIIPAGLLLKAEGPITGGAHTHISRPLMCPQRAQRHQKAPGPYQLPPARTSGAVSAGRASTFSTAAARAAGPEANGVGLALAKPLCPSASLGAGGATDAQTPMSPASFDHNALSAL